MGIQHVKSNTIGDFTGTVTVFNSQGSTVTAAATDLVRPADWNSYHNQFLSLSGNTSNSSNLSGTNIVFQGGNNITLSGTTAAGAATVVFSGPHTSQFLTTQTNQTIGIYGSSNTTGQSSSSTVDARSLTFRGLGNVSVGMSAGEVLISATGGGAGDGVNIVAAGTQTANTTGTVLFADSNGISFGMSNSSRVTASYTVPSTAGLISAVNWSAGTTSNNSASIWFRDSNGISFGLNAGTITGTVKTDYQSSNANYLTSQSNQALSGSNGSFTFQTATFGNLNGASFYTSNGSLVVSYTVPTQTNQSLGGYFVGNTTGQSSSSTWDARTLSIQGDGIVSAGWSNGSIRVSATQSNQAVSNSAGSFTFQTLNFSDANNVTWGTSAGGIVTASVAAPGAAAENNWFNLLGANTAGNTTASGSTIGLSGINVTLSGTNGSVINVSAAGGGGAAISAGTQSVNTGTVIFSNSNGISFGMSDSSVITAGLITYSSFNPFVHFNITNTRQQASLHFANLTFPNIQFDRVNFFIYNSNSSNSSGSHTLSFWIGFYTKNASTLSLVTSSSTSYAITHSGTAGSYSLYSAGRVASLGMTTTLTAGNYIVGFLSRTTSGGADGSYSIGAQSLGLGGTNLLGRFGTQADTAALLPGMGWYSATTNAMPNSVAFSHIYMSASSVVRMPWIAFISDTV